MHGHLAQPRTPKLVLRTKGWDEPAEGPLGGHTRWQHQWEQRVEMQEDCIYMGTLPMDRGLLGTWAASEGREGFGAGLLWLQQKGGPISTQECRPRVSPLGPGR